MVAIGKRNNLTVLREATPGLFLDGQELGDILLPRRYIPAKVVPGDKLDVFVYLDSEDRLVATTENPLVMVDEIACLKVIGLNRNVGAFLDWGLSKDLLLPFREQERPLRIGDKVVVAVYLDSKTKRLVATTRLQRHLGKTPPLFPVGHPVNIFIASQSPLGYSAVVENSHLGLLYHDTVPTPLQVGQTLKGFVRAIRPGGKIDLSLDKAGYKRVAPLKEQILQAIRRNGGHLDFDDNSSPEKIRQTFGVSKKAFKQALGALYKSREIRFQNPGVQLLDNSAWEPGKESEPVKNQGHLPARRETKPGRKMEA